MLNRVAAAVLTAALGTLAVLGAATIPVLGDLLAPALAFSAVVATCRAACPGHVGRADRIAWAVRQARYLRALPESRARPLPPLTERRLVPLTGWPRARCPRYERPAATMAAAPDPDETVRG
jgi:hypothetical protein